MTWQLQDAKNKLSEVVQSSIEHGPQIISRYGKNTAVVISYVQYKKTMTPKKDIKEIFARARREGLGELDISRDSSVTGRGSEFAL